MAICFVILNSCVNRKSSINLEDDEIQYFEYLSFYSKGKALRFADTKNDTSDYLLEEVHSTGDSLFLVKYLRIPDSSLFWNKHYPTESSKRQWLLGLDSINQRLIFIYPSDMVFDYYPIDYENGHLLLDYTKCGVPPIPMSLLLIKSNNMLKIQSAKQSNVDSLLINMELRRGKITDLSQFRYRRCYCMPLYPSVLGL